MIFNGGDGSLLAISFYFDYGSVTITSTETDEGKLEGWEIALIIIAIVIIVVCVIIYLCYRRKKSQQTTIMTTAAQSNVYPSSAMPSEKPYNLIIK